MSIHKCLLSITALAAMLPMLSACPRENVAEIRYTEFGVAHIRANDYASLGFGQGYAQARDNLCKIEQGMLAFSGELSRHFGPDAAGSTLGGGTSLSSDLYFRGLNDSGVIERLVAQPAPLGPRREVRELIRGYVKGFNQVLAKRPSVECRDAAWVRPMTELDVYRRVYAVTLLMGQGLFASASIASAEAPLVVSEPSGMSTTERATAVAHAARSFRQPMTPGSNAVAIGREASSTGGGLNVANPHLSWDMDMRWWQAQLTLPNRMDVSGATLIGVPLVVMGHTSTVAWSITTAEKARRFTVFELQLVDGSPTDYLVDGRVESMQRRTVSVQVKREDGTLETVSRDQWTSRFGPLLGPGFALELPPWGAADSGGVRRAYAFRDANATNMRMLNLMFALNHARTVDDVATAVRETQGAPWWTVVAADARGETLFSQVHVVPNLTDAHASECNTELGQVLFDAAGIAILDGSRSACDWATDPDAVEPGIFGPGALSNPRLPLLRSTAYVEHSNDSHWLPNAVDRITGMPRILGAEATSRGLRTRGAMHEISEQLAREPFNRQAMEALVFSNRSYGAELALADTVNACRSLAGGVALSSDGRSVEVSEACEVLAGWDGRMDVDSRGALLFDRYWQRVDAATGGDDAALWLVPFDPEDPLHTPNTLAVGPIVSTALADAVSELEAAAIPLEAALGDYQSVERNGERIPLGGGGGGERGVLGVFNLVDLTFTPERGYTEPVSGSGYLHIVQFDGTPCPDAVTLLTYSQSSEPSSRHYADQTALYSRKGWVRDRFCERDILASPEFESEFVVTEDSAGPVLHY